MMGIGIGCCASGAAVFIAAELIRAFTMNLIGYYEDGPVSKPLMIYGGVSTATGTGLIVGGTVKRKKVGKVVTKRETRISLLPRIDTTNDRYGMQLSHSF